jgi:hypothetical protein
MLVDSNWFKQGRVKQLVIEVHFRSNGEFSQTNNNDAVPVEVDAALLSKLTNAGFSLFNLDENWKYSSVLRMNGLRMYNCLELSYLFVGTGNSAPPLL